MFVLCSRKLHTHHQNLYKYSHDSHLIICCSLLLKSGLHLINLSIAKPALGQEHRTYCVLQPYPTHAKFTMAPLNGKNSASASRGSKRPHDDSDGNTSGEEFFGSDPIASDCPFQVEILRQAATDSISETGDMNSVYTVRPAATWDSMNRFKKFSGEFTALSSSELTLTKVGQ